MDALVISPEMPDADREIWVVQIDEIRERIETWTGNRCDAVVLDLETLLRAAAENDLPLRSARVMLLLVSSR